MKILLFTNIIKSVYCKLALVFLTEDSRKSKDDEYWSSFNLGQMIQKAGLTVKFVPPTNFKQVLKTNIVELVAFPGSNLDIDDFFNQLSRSDVKSIRKYVRKGGRYIGMCMGAYITGKCYFRFNKLYFQEKESVSSNAQLVPIEYIGTKRNVYIEEPPEFGKNPSENIKGNIRILSRYQDGTVDIFIQEYKRGKVALVSSHPEATEDWSDDFKILDNSYIGTCTIKKLLS